MNCWDTLEIQATDNLSDIKKAYAKKLKTNHPEDNPTGFQALKEAYDIALKLAKIKGENGTSTFIDDMISNIALIPIQKYDEFIENHPIIDILNSNFSPDHVKINPIFNWDGANSEFLSQLDMLYSDFFERIKLENWTKLFNQDVMWDLKNRMVLKPMVIDFLSSHFYLPKNIWKLIDENFNLSNQEDNILSEYNSDFSKYVFNILNRPIPLNYSYVQNVKDQQFDIYFDLKEKAYDLLEAKDSREAEKYLLKAKELCENDPDLFIIEGIINFLIKKFDKAILFFNQALSINAMI